MLSPHPLLQLDMLVMGRLAVVAIVAALGLTACGTTTAVTTPNSTTSPPSTVATSTPPTSTTPTSTTPTTAAVAHVGSTLSVAGFNGESLDVTLAQIIDPATSNQNAVLAGTRFVATELTIKNTSGAALTGDADNDATIVGSDGQTYTPATFTVAECTNFDYGQYQLAAGESANGCVTFALPTGVTAAKFKFDTSGGSLGAFGEWVIP